MALSLSNLIEKITGSMGSGSESVLGIDIGSSSAKIVQLRGSHGAAVLETYGEIALAPYQKQAVGKAVRLTPEQLGTALSDLMREANITARVGGASIPFSASLISVIGLPDVGPEQLKRIVPIEARKYIPVAVSEVSLDWFVIPKDSTENSAFDTIQNKQQATTKANAQEVLLVAIHNDVVSAHQQIMQQAGVSARFFEVEIFSSIRSSLGHGIAPYLVVDMGAATTKMYVVERGVVRLTHLVTAGGQHMTEQLSRSLSWDFEKAERIKREHGLLESHAFSIDENDRIKSALLSTLTRIFTEIDRVLLSYGQRYNKNVSQVILCGGGASLPGLIETAKTSLNSDVVLANPFARTEAPAFLTDTLASIGPGFAVSVGLAFRSFR